MNGFIKFTWCRRENKIGATPRPSVGAAFVRACEIRSVAQCNGYTSIVMMDGESTWEAEESAEKIMEQFANCRGSD